MGCHFSSDAKGMEIYLKERRGSYFCCPTKKRKAASFSEWKGSWIIPIQPDLQMNFSLNILNHHEILMNFQQSSHEKHDTSLFGGLEPFFFHILGISSSQLTFTHIFQRGRDRYTTNQDTSPWKLPLDHHDHPPQIPQDPSQSSRLGTPIAAVVTYFMAFIQWLCLRIGHTPK